MSGGLPAWAYVLAVLVLLWLLCVWFGSYNSGYKVKCWKIENGYRVRDYAAERELARRTRTRR